MYFAELAHFSLNPRARETDGSEGGIVGTERDSVPSLGVEGQGLGVATAVAGARTCSSTRTSRTPLACSATCWRALSSSRAPTASIGT